MEDERLLELNSLGLIPGPAESRSDFLFRAEYCLNLYANWPNLIPSDDKVMKMGEVVGDSLKKTKKLFDIKPDWIPLFFSNYQLMPWHGGAAWIFQKDDESPTSAFFQLRKVFQKKQKYLGLYDRDELIAHEVSHVGRMCFEEPKFEELIAYRASDSKFRSYFGSIVQTATESMIFVSIIFLILVLDFFLISFGYDQALKSVQLLKLIPVGLVALGCIRLVKRQRMFSKALHNLESICSNPQAVIYRLTDCEIESFAKMPPAETLKYFQDNASTSLRLHVITLAYM